MAWKGGDKSAGGKRSGVAAGFVGLGDYLANSKERGGPDHRIVAFGSNFDAADIHHAMREMDCVASQNARLKKPVFHWGFSLPKDKDTGQPLEQLSPEQWEALAYHSIRELGLEHHQVAWVLHEDAGHQHIHLVANRQSLEGGPAWRPSHDHYQMRATARWAELEFDLSRHLEPSRTAAHRRTDREFRAVRMEGNATFWSDVLPEFRDAISWHDLAGRLAPKGLSVEPARDHEGGLILRHSSGPAKALSSVHPSLTGPKLASRFGETHRDFLERNLSVPEPTAAERRPLDVDTLLNEISAHRALWTEADARRAARPFPDGSDVLQELWTSDRLLEVRPGLYTTRETVAMEDATFALAEKMRSRGHAVDLATGESLAGEHLEVVRAALGDEGLFILQGPPGSGKTTAARALVDSYRSAGYDVYGAAVTGKAAEGLREAADIDARTLAAWRRDWKYKPDSGGKPSVMIVDEASMLSLQDMRPLLEHADERNMKLILIGDVDQLPPVGAGDPYRRMLEEFSSARLTEIHRQQVEWMRDASNALVRGEVREALTAYEERGHLHWTETAEDARSALVMQYFEDRSAAPDQSSLLVAYRNADVRALNEEIRELRRERGELQDGERIHSKEFAPGDRVLFRRNERRWVHGENGQPVPVQNGTLGTVTEIEQDRVSVRLDSGVDVRFDPAEYSDLDHGYAVSLYKSQGVTVDRAYVLTDRHVDAHGFMVAATRHRRHLEIHVPQEQFKDLDAVERVFSRRARADLVRDYTDRPLGRPVEPGLEPGPTRRSVDATAVDLEIWRTTIRAYRYRSSDDLPSAADISGLDRRIEAIREASAQLPISEERRFSIDRLTELSDQLRHQVAGREVLWAAWRGQQEAYTEALDRYRTLPEPRLLSEPSAVATPDTIRRPLAEALPESLREGVRALEDHAYRHRQAAEQQPGDERPLPLPLLEHWREIADRAGQRLDRVAEHSRDYAEASERLNALGSDVQHAPDAAREALRIAELEKRIERLLEVRSTPREVLDELDRRVAAGVAHRIEHSSPIDEVWRAYGSLVRHGELEKRIHRLNRDLEELIPDRRGRERPEIRVSYELHDVDARIDNRAHHDFLDIYANPSEALAAFRRARERHDVEEIADALKRDPEVFGRLKGIPLVTRPRAVATAERLGKRLDVLAEEREYWIGVRDQVDKVVEKRRLLWVEGLDLGKRPDLVNTIRRHGLSLSKPELQTLPDAVREQVAEARRAEKKLEGQATKLLRDLAKVSVSIAKSSAKRQALKLAPKPVRQIVDIAQKIRALKRNAPAYLATQMLPPQVRLAVYVVRSVSAAIQRSLERDRGQELGW